MSQLYERIQFFSTRNPTQKDFQEMVNGAKRLEYQNQKYKKELSKIMKLVDVPNFHSGYIREIISIINQLKEQGR